MTAQELEAGYQEILVDLFEASKDDVTAEIQEHLDDLSRRAAQYTLAAGMGDPAAADNLERVKGIVLSILAQLNRKEADRIEATVMNAIALITKFVVGVALAA